MERWNGRVALVTGASVGIGSEICRQLVKHGMNVFGCARNVEKIQAIAKEEAVQKAMGHLFPIKCDLSNESDIFTMFNQINKQFGQLDVCINNAGFATQADLLSGATCDWKNMLDVNILAVCICTREAVKLMRQKGIDDGQIIQISSMAGHRIPPTGASFYAGTKFMLRALTEGLRRELTAANSHIRVASISPGLVETEFAYRMLGDEEKARKLYGSIECLQGKDIADSVIYILQTPPHVDVNDILIRPAEQAF